MAAMLVEPARRDPLAQVRRVVSPIVASWAILLASFANFLRYNAYPLLKPEIALIALAMLVLAAVVGWFHQNRGRTGQAVLDMLLVMFVVNQNGATIPMAVAIAAVVLAISIWLKRSILPVIGMLAAFIFLCGVFGIGQQRNAPAETSRAVVPSLTGRLQPPALVHIILDEQLGIEGFSGLGTDGRIVGNTLKSFFLSHGFHLYGRAYAQQFRTVNSIPQILNFGSVVMPKGNPFHGQKLERNAYFDTLSKEGYKINVYQSDFIDYCNNIAVTKCLTYSFSGLSPIATSALSTPDRAIVISARFVLLSEFVRYLERQYIDLAATFARRGRGLPYFGLIAGGRTSPVAASAAFDRLITDLHHAQPGTAYFAHILLPHDPYQLNADCSTKPMWQWRVHDPDPQTAARQAAYFGQVLCALRKVDSAYAAIKQSPVGGNFIMVIHGDHGSRITRVNPIVENVGRYDRDDLIAGFSTLFAVRGPKISPGYEELPAAVPWLLGTLAQSDFTALPPPSTSASQIILNDRHWLPRQRAPFLQTW